VEAGKMDVEPRAVLLTDLVQGLRRSLQPVADQKGLTLTMEIGSGASEAILTDAQRLQQVLKNLLSNAFKFTDHGTVSLRIELARDVSRLQHKSLRNASRVVAFEVSDTGVGIPPEKQRLIFDAFQQADGTTSRKYGGTGLGLSISREIAQLLGGEIHVVSKPGQGSTFTLYLPDAYDATDKVVARTPRTRAPEAPSGESATGLPVPPRPRPLEDDRMLIRPGDRVLLIIEDDEEFARILMTTARDAGFKTVVATRGDTGLALAAQLQPSAITLDVALPVLDGWTILDRLKRNLLTRHIPVNVISIVARSQGGASLGAFSYLEKPVTKDALEGAFAHLRSFVDRTIRTLLLVEDSDIEQGAIAGAIAETGGVEVMAVKSAEEALAALEKQPFDCMVVDLILPGLDGVSLIADVKRQERYRDLPVVVYTSKDLDEEEEKKLKQFASSVIVKAGLSSLDRLAENTSFFLHRVSKRVGPTPAGNRSGRTVLIVDDDVRNIFALSSVLEAAGHNVVYAEDGRAGIETLARQEGIDVVLMDIMMPHMDGYETLRAIRQNPRYAALPVIAVTAKALTEDREKCLIAGASDYLAKPVDPQVLLERIGHWTLVRNATIGSAE
jgi:CheY-like chemotaxis protein/two-component sensor histidine kinase